MCFKNTFNNTFNRPAKLLRLDSTGETTKENCDHTPPVKVISAYDAKKLTGKKSCFEFLPQRSLLSLGLANNMGSFGFMNNFSHKFCGRERDMSRKDIQNVKMSQEKVTMRGEEQETQSWRSWPNQGGTSKTYHNGFWTNPRNFTSLKVPADSPWLKVNSGYFQPHPKGSYNNYHSHFWGSRNNFCDKNNSSNNRIKSKHKKVSDEKQNCVPVASSHSSVNSKPTASDVCSKDLSDPQPVIKDASSTILVKPAASDVCSKGTTVKPTLSDVCSKDFSDPKTVIKDSTSTMLVKPTVSDVCCKSGKEISPESDHGVGNDNKIVPVAKEVSKDPNNSCESESRFKKCPDVINVRYTIDSCVADLFQGVDSNSQEKSPKDSKETRNFQIQCQPDNQQIRITEMVAPSSAAIPSAINCQNTNSQIHLSIIGGKCQSKQQTPPNSVCSQSKISEDCQSNKTTPTDSNQSKQNCDSKSAQEKNCSLCMAYMSRMDPKCTEFPKSAGCKHSTILLRVRDTPKKTKKRKNSKADVKKTSPSSFIVGVKSSESFENSHIFQFISNDSESESDGSWDSFDEDETDSAACDWSKLEMDKLFPGSNGLFNPIKFNVHFSPSETETSDPSSPTNNYLDSINLSWNIHIYEDQPKDSPCRKSKTQKKVRFEEGEKLATVHPMEAWCRKGPWEQYARDRERFNRRIRESEEVLSKILKDSHRSQIYNSICGNSD